MHRHVRAAKGREGKTFDPIYFSIVKCIRCTWTESINSCSIHFYWFETSMQLFKLFSLTPCLECGNSKAVTHVSILYSHSYLEMYIYSHRHLPFNIHLPPYTHHPSGVCTRLELKCVRIPLNIFSQLQKDGDDVNLPAEHWTSHSPFCSFRII